VPKIDILQDILISAAQSKLPNAQEKIGLAQSSKADGSIVTEVDAALQNEIQSQLKHHWPNISMLGEEMPNAEQTSMLKHSEAGLWVLDPLDGTTNFTTSFPIFGLSLAYVKGGKTIAAVIYDPNRKECFTAEIGKGAFLNGEKMGLAQTDKLSNCVANVDYKRLTAELSNRLVSCPPYRSQRNMGSCVLEWCWLAANRIQLYLHGGQQLWDHAAGRLILAEAGGVATSLNGNEMVSNRLVKQSAIAASNPVLYEQWFAWIQSETQTAIKL
jgi:myo-inositol-1(or 4)-monophosphatase